MRSIDYGDTITTGFEPLHTRPLRETGPAARHSGDDSPSQHPRELVRPVKNKTQVQYQVRSTEGDTVALSANALQQTAVARAAAAGAGAGGGGVAVAAVAAYSPPGPTVEVEERLSEAEIQVLQKVLAQFSQQQAASGPTLVDYSFVNSKKRASSPVEPPQK
ncbi:hypothetical protein F183_A23690 [Bryobacterales bacterium F-183]|nr:hypothetical protein F183_A23690 [Bryobacterales bacterium F-183]